MDNIEELKSQLARKEQECQQAMDNYVQLDLQRVKEYNELVDLYKAKEQECEDLKEAIDRLLKIQYQLADSCNKYVQTLTEIKEIAETISLPMGTGKSSNRVILAKQILQKISECEVEDDNK